MIVDDECLRVGKGAKHALSLRSITEVDPLTSGQRARFTSPYSGGAGARVFCPYWISRAVFVAHDEQMPLDSVREAFSWKPVWVIGTRQPEQLATVLREAAANRRF